MRLLKEVEHLAWQYQTGDLLEATSRASAFHRVGVLILAGVLVGIMGNLIRKTLGRPGESESAIWYRSGRLPTLSTLAQSINSIVTVAMGTSLGRESPIKQAGGAIASRIAQWGGLSRAEERLLVACGVGAGMAAAYNVPVGGALFAVEVLLGSISLRLALPALVCSGVATVSSWLLLPTGPIYRVPEYPISMQLTIWAVLVGPLLGLLTIPLIRAIGWADLHKPRNNLATVITPVLVLGMLGAVSIAYPQLLGNGKDVVQRALLDDFAIPLLLVLPILKLMATAGCLSGGASGGLFTPTMTIGALLGALFGHAWNCIVPGASMGACAVIGSCAFLAAASQGPISALVLVLELTRHIDATMVPMLLAVTGAMLTARRLESQSVYSVRLHLKDLHTYLASKALPPAFDRLFSRPASIIYSSSGYAQVAESVLSSKSDNSIYAVDHQMKLIGVIRSDLLRAERLGAMPLEAAKAADLTVSLTPLTSSMSEREILQRLSEVEHSELPVVDVDSGLVIGVVSTSPREPA